ncbi:hypothetical protein HK098_000077 [Nowakowskiella sp. JEL0407]|nr:hypothetical protein HK098_000077 [Nowakowskiella sp. JEL0407]
MKPEITPILIWSLMFWSALQLLRSGLTISRSQWQPLLPNIISKMTKYHCNITLLQNTTSLEEAFWIEVNTTYGDKGPPWSRNGGQTPSCISSRVLTIQNPFQIYSNFTGPNNGSTAITVPCSESQRQQSLRELYAIIWENGPPTCDLLESDLERLLDIFGFSNTAFRSLFPDRNRFEMDPEDGKQLFQRLDVNSDKKITWYELAINRQEIGTAASLQTTNNQTQTSTPLTQIYLLQLLDNWLKIQQMKDAGVQIPKYLYF